MTLLFWVSFLVLIAILLALDLGLFRKGDDSISTREALIRTSIWVSLALCFNVFVYFAYERHWLGMGLGNGAAIGGAQAALEFFTGYLVEESLSLDNIFVIALIFTYFRIPPKYQHRVLFWGIIGAVLMRGVLIVLGSALVARFTWLTYIFGGVLILTAVKMLIERHDNLEPEKDPLVKLVRRLFPIAEELHGNRFFIRVNGVRTATPLFLVLVLVESTDLLFAFDSIPAVFAVTKEPFLIFTSNIFAILGLRSLYFALAGLMTKFRYLKMSLVYLLAYIGVKMIVVHHYPIPTGVSLAVIIGILSVGVLASWVGNRRDTARLESPLQTDEEMQ